jgi:two-component system, NarL family, response regulator DevR
VSSSVLIIDDHPLVRDGVRRSLTAAGFDCVGEAGSLKEAIAMIALHNPDVVTVDLNLPDGSGLEVISWARKNSATIAIIVLTLEDDLELISAACQAGAQGFISKSQSADHLVSAINSVLAQPQVFISNQTIALLGREKFQGLLSPREMMVLTHLNGELSVVEIARAIFVSEATVKSHCASIYRKLETHSRRSAVARAKTIGLL